MTVAPSHSAWDDGLGQGYPWIVRQPLLLNHSARLQIDYFRRNVSSMGKRATLMMEATSRSESTSGFSAILPHSLHGTHLAAVVDDVRVRFTTTEGTTVQVIRQGKSILLPSTGDLHTVLPSETSTNEQPTVWAYVHNCSFGQLHRALQMLSNRGLQT